MPSISTATARLRSTPASASTITSSRRSATARPVRSRGRARGDLGVDEHHDRGRGARPRRGVRRGARRPGRDRPVRRRVGADGRVAGDHDRRAGRPCAVVELPFRGERVGEPAAAAGRACDRGVRATARATIHVRGTGRNDHHLAEAAFKALGRALRAACEPDPRRRGGLDEGRPRMTATDGPRIAVVDYDAGNLISIEQALTSVGARHTSNRAARSRRRRRPGRAGCRGRGAGDGPAAGRRAGRADPRLDRDRPAVPRICLGLQLLFEGSDEDGAETLGVLPGRTRRLVDAPTLPHIGWNQVERRRAIQRSTGSPRTPTSTSSTRTPASRTALTTSSWRRRRTAAGSCPRWRGPAGRGPVPGPAGDDGLRLLGSFAALASAYAASAPVPA